MRREVHEGWVFCESGLEVVGDGDEVDLPEQVEIHGEEVGVVAVHVQVPLRQRDVPDAQLAALPLPHLLPAETHVLHQQKRQLFLDRQGGTSSARTALRSMQYRMVNSTKQCSGSPMLYT